MLNRLPFLLGLAAALAACGGGEGKEREKQAPLVKAEAARDDALRRPDRRGRHRASPTSR